MAKLASAAANKTLAKPLSLSCSEMLHVILKSLACTTWPMTIPGVIIKRTKKVL
jgi:hypothetical protein